MDEGLLAVIVTPKYVFIHIPKNAGTSIQQALLGDHKGNHFPGHQTISELESRQGHHPQWKFAIVRNSWDRVLSLYSHMTQKSTRYPDWLEMGFNEWVIKELETTTETRWKSPNPRGWPKLFSTPQLEWIRGSVFVGRFEELEHDFKRVCDHLDIKATLPHNERTRTKHEHYRDVYNDAARKKVGTIFGEDIRYFDQEF